MVWQDIVLSIANGALIFPLIPTVINKDAKVPRWTSIPTGFFIGVIGIVYATLGFWFAFGTAITQTILWTFIAVRRPVRS